MDGKTLSEYAVEYGRSKGADYVEARFEDSVDENYFARNGQFLGIQKNPSRGIGIRVLKDGCLGFGSVDRLEKKDVEDRIDSIAKMAESSKREKPIEFSGAESVEDSWRVPVKTPFKDISRDEKKKYVKELDETIKKRGKGQKLFGSRIKNRIIFFQMSTSDKYIVTSEGSKVDSSESFISLYTVWNAKTRDEKEQRMLGKGGSAGWEWLEEEDLIGFVGEESEKLVSSVENAKNFDFDRPLDVVVGPEVSGIIAHENVGHPSEADRIMGRETAQAGGSFYRELFDTEEGLEEGEVKLGSDAVTVIDDPTMEKSPGFYLYDDEGIEAQPRYLIEDGYLNELLLNREYSDRFGTASNGAARSASYSREPIPRMSNTFFEPGEHTKEELIEDIERGVLLKSFTEWNIDDRRYHSKYVGLEAYLIQNGKVTDTMVKRPTLELTTPEILESIDAVANDYESRMNFCGKSDPMQPVRVSTGGPHLRMRDVRVR